MIKRNPCRIKGADREESPVRPVLSVEQVYALADAVGLRYRALILLAAFTSLRWAELAALTPADIDLDALTVRVTRQLDYHRKGYDFGPPKSKAGVRTVPFPELIAPDLRQHLRLVPFPVSLVFSTSTGTPAVALQLPPTRLASSPGRSRPERRSPSRPAAHRQPAHGQRGRQPETTDGPDGARQRTGRADLPSLLGGTSAHAG
jgi:integrase